MINNKYNFIFVHIPKTAGISIYNALKAQGKEQHHKKLSQHQPNQSYFSFAFVRNPWDRFVSNYFYFKNYGRGRWGDLPSGDIVNKFLTFNDFCSNFESIIEEFPLPHFKKMCFWTQEDLSFIGRFENLQSDFNHICEKINYPKTSLTHLNTSNRNHYSEYYTEKSKNIVGNFYEQDIINFKYSFKNH